MPDVYDPEEQISKEDKRHRRGESAGGYRPRNEGTSSGERSHRRSPSTGHNLHQDEEGGDDSVASQEATSATATATSSDKAESDRVGRGYTSKDDSKDDEDDKPGKKKGWFTKKRAALGGGGTAAIIALIIGGASIGQGPLKLIHAAQLLQDFHFSSDEEFMDSRTGKFIRWARTRNAQEKRNLDYFGNKLADRYERRMIKAGITPSYTSGRMDVLTFDNNNGKAREALDELRGRENLGFDIPDPDASGRVRVELPTGFNSTRLRRSVYKGVINSMGWNKIMAAISKRILTMRAGIDWHPFKNITRSADESFWEHTRKVREAMEERYRKGADDPDVRFNGQNDEDGDGGSSPNATNNDAASGAGSIADSDLPNIKSQLTDVFTRGVGVAGAATLICSLDQLGDSIPALRQTNLVLPLMRVGMDIVTMGNQIMSGQGLNLDEVGAVVTKMYDEDAPNGSKEFVGAKSIKANLGEDASTAPDIPNSARPNTERPQIFQVINTITGATGISQVCGFVTSTAGGWAVDIADWATSGGPASAIVAAVTDTLAGIALSSFIDDIALWIAGDPLDVSNAFGARLGSFADYGVLLGANEAAISHGGVAMSNQSSLEWRKETDAIARAEFQQRSAYDRYFNPYEAKSMVGTALIKNPELTSPTGTVASFFQLPMKAISGIFGNMSKGLMPKSIAAPASNYDYGFPRFGFTVPEMDDERYENPFENAERVEPHLNELNAKYGDCFGTTINPDTLEINTRTDQGVRYDLLADGEETDEGDFSHCDDTSNEFKDYRFYLADQYNIKSQACYENIDVDVCKEVIEGIEEPEGPAPGPTGPVAQPGADTSNIPCPVDPEITDGGIGEKFGPGRVLQYRIRICILRGSLDLNVSVAQNAMNMIRAAEAAGVRGMLGGGYRTFDEQVALRSTNGCPDTYNAPSSSCRVPTARPGNSNHESGEAIDVTCGGSIIRRGSACFVWLQGNAGNFGFINLPSESWHWSINGN